MVHFIILHILQHNRNVQQTQGIDSKINILIHSWMHKINANERNIDIIIASKRNKKQK